MDEKRKKDIGSRMMNILLQGQSSGKSQNEIAEGIRAGLASDHLNFDEGLKHGATVADPAKYARAMDGKDERPRKPQRLERDIIGRIERAKQESAAIANSPEFREKVLRQKRAMIHKVMTQRGTDELAANIRGYDVTLLRLPETGQDGLRKLKMFVSGNEIPDKDFNDALAEVAGLNDNKAFNAGAAIGKNLRDQAAIQGARTATQVGLNALTAPGRAVSRSHQKNAAMISAIMRTFLRMILSMGRAR